MTTIVFSTTNALISRIIRALTRSKVSHAVVCTEMMGVPVVLQATIDGVHMKTRARWAKSNTVIYEFQVLPDVSSGVRHALEHLGDKYDVVGLLGYIPILLARWFGKKIKNPLASPSSEVCAEFVLHLNHEKLLPEWNALDPEATSPQDLADVCMKGASFKGLTVPQLSGGAA